MYVRPRNEHEATEVLEVIFLCYLCYLLFNSFPLEKLRTRLQLACFFVLASASQVSFGLT